MPAHVPYHESSHALRAELARSVSRETLRALHEVSGWRHALVVARQLALLAGAVLVVLRWGDLWWAWVPASVLIGLVVFSFLHLLHEVVHRTVFAKRASPWNRVLGLLYGIPGGLAPSQFERWHLDHHEWLGTEDRDPKRANLTPKVVKRWYKALYVTPALFPIYFRAAARAAKTYDPALNRRIAWERRAALALHLGTAAALWATLGLPLALKLHVLPVFVVFPFVFTVNRLGQHYDVNPGDPAAWGTLMRKSPFLWDFLFLWTNYHLEHHYFPRVPMYRMPALRKALDPFFAQRGIRPRSYGGLLWDWFVLNRVPHTDWAK